MNILIVEDDTAIREGVAEFLKENEYEVFCAEDGEKALEILKTLPRPRGSLYHPLQLKYSFYTFLFLNLVLPC